MSSFHQSTFAFKHFQLVHGGETWKVGTDSILLGSWCDIKESSMALDVGTGTGILSLMLAQRNAALQIDALEIMPDAILIAEQNIRDSRWRDRIHVLQDDAYEYVGEGGYDVIICNPPYFPDGVSSARGARKVSRQGSGFALWDLPDVAQRNLLPSGVLHTIIPVAAAYRFIEFANDVGLYVYRRCSVRHTRNSAESLILLSFIDRPSKVRQETLVLFEDERPTEEYLILCQDFLL